MQGQQSPCSLQDRNRLMDDFAILQSTPLFRGLSAETLVRLLDRLGAVRRSYIRGAVLVRAGQPSHSVGVILAGSIEAARLARDCGFTSCWYRTPRGFAEGPLPEI